MERGSNPENTLTLSPPMMETTEDSRPDNPGKAPSDWGRRRSTNDNLDVDQNVDQDVDNDHQRRKWVSFFDRERCRHYSDLLKRKRFVEVLAQLREFFQSSNTLDPPVDLQPPEVVYETPAKSDPEADYDTIIYGTSIASGSLYSSLPCNKHSKYGYTRNVFVVVLALLVLMASAVGVVLHFYFNIEIQHKTIDYLSVSKTITTPYSILKTSSSSSSTTSSSSSSSSSSSFPSTLPSSTPSLIFSSTKTANFISTTSYSASSSSSSTTTTRLSSLPTSSLSSQPPPSSPTQTSSSSPPSPSSSSSPPPASSSPSSSSPPPSSPTQTQTSASPTQTSSSPPSSSSPSSSPSTQTSSPPSSSSPPPSLPTQTSSPPQQSSPTSSSSSPLPSSTLNATTLSPSLSSPPPQDTIISLSSNVIHKTPHILQKPKPPHTTPAPASNPPPQQPSATTTSPTSSSLHSTTLQLQPSSSPSSPSTTTPSPPTKNVSTTNRYVSIPTNPMTASQTPPPPQSTTPSATTINNNYNIMHTSGPATTEPKTTTTLAATTTATTTTASTTTSTPEPTTTTTTTTTTTPTTTQPTTTSTTTTTTTPPTTTTPTTTTTSTTTTTTTTTTTPYVPAETLDPFATFFGGSDGFFGGGGGMDNFGGSNMDGGGDGFGGVMGSALPPQPPTEEIPQAIARKVAVTAAPLTTQPPPSTPKPPEIKITAPDVTAEIGMGPTSKLKVTCTAEKAWGWTYMAISRYEGETEFSLEFLGGVEKQDEWPFIPIDSRMSDFSLHRDEHMVTLSLEKKLAMCDDKGRYLCEVKVNKTFHKKTFDVSVKKKPDPPKLSFPEDVFSGDSVLVTTDWDAGYPVLGYLVHEVIRGFTGLVNSVRGERTTSKRNACAIIFKNTFYVVPQMSWNNTEMMVRILPKADISPYYKRVVESVKPARKTLLVIDRQICAGQRYQKVAHPYDCNKYITCHASGPRISLCPYFHCFDQRTRGCVREEFR